MTQTTSSLIPTFIDSLELGAPQRVRSLTVWPLRRHAPAGSRTGLSYMPLSQAMEKGLAQVEELDSGGSVPNIRVKNHADVALLVLFGEEILGAKQNRIANASFLVGSEADTVIDVSCVEAGRWVAPVARPQRVA